jgi:hypothetical protein
MKTIPEFCVAFCKGNTWLKGGVPEVHIEGKGKLTLSEDNA